MFKKINNYLDSIKINALLIISIVSFSTLIFWLILKTKYQYSFGSDEIIVLSIPSYAIMHASNLLELIKAYAYSLFYEDHLNITTNIISKIIFSFLDNNSLNNITATIYCLTLVTFYFLAKQILDNKRLAIFAVFIATSNFVSIWYISSSNITFILSLMFQLLTINLAIKNLKVSSINSLILLSLICLIGTFTFENYFLCLFVIATFFVMDILKHSTGGLKKIFNEILERLYLVISLVLGVLPYLIIHYLKYNTIMPGTRADDFDINPFVPIAFSGEMIINELLLGIPKLIFETSYVLPFLIIFSLILVSSVFLFSYLNQDKKDLYLFNFKNSITLLICVGVCVFIASTTGRYHPGMWTLCWFLFSLFITKLIFGNPNKNHGSTTSNILVPYIFPFIILTISLLTLPDSSRLRNTNDRAYLFDTALSSFQEIYPENTTYIDLTTDNIFHPIRVLVSERTIQGMAPAEISLLSYGAQPIKSHITYGSDKFISKFSENNNFDIFKVAHNVNIMFIMDWYLILGSNNNKKPNWTIYQWDKCEKRQSRFDNFNNNNYQTIESNKMMVMELLQNLDIKEEGIQKIISKTVCLKTGYFRKDMLNVSEIYPMDQEIIRSYSKPCRLELFNNSVGLKVLAFLPKDSSFYFSKQNSYPLTINSMPFDLKIKDRERAANYFQINNENEFILSTDNFCKFESIP